MRGTEGGAGLTPLGKPPGGALGWNCMIALGGGPRGLRGPALMTAAPAPLKSPPPYPEAAVAAVPGGEKLESGYLPPPEMDEEGVLTLPPAPFFSPLSAIREAHIAALCAGDMVV